MTGLCTPPGLALDQTGNIFVAEPQGHRISVVPASTTQAVLFAAPVRQVDPGSRRPASICLSRPVTI